MKKYFSLLAILLSFTSLKAQVFQEWAQRFNGPDSLFDMAIALDVHGCIYVTGRTDVHTPEGFFTYAALLKYSPSGILQWSAINDESVYVVPNAIAADNDCNVYICGLADNDFFTAKYDSNGVKKWFARYGNTSSAVANDLKLDSNGNVYVTGNGDGGLKWTTIKYNSQGEEQWVRLYQADPNGTNSGNAIAIEKDGNIYITGQSYSGTSFDLTTLSYSSDGTLRWTMHYNGTGNSTDVGTDIALDKNSNVYVTGLSIGSGTGFDFVTIKYSSPGVQQWVQRFDGPLHNTDAPSGIALDSKGNITITGKITTAVDTIFFDPFDPFGFFLQPVTDMLTIQYNKDGMVRWIQQFDGPGHKDDFATALAVDKKDNIYITGASDGSGAGLLGLDYITTKYSSKGELTWLQRYNFANSWDQANDIAVDDKDNVYVTGLSAGTGTNFDFATIKYVQRNFPPGYGGVTLNTNLDMLEFVNEVAYASVMDSLMHQVSLFTGDNGNTQALLTLINSNTPPGQIKNQLITSSPLTDTVLVATINSSMPPGHKKNILVANTPFSDKVDRAIMQSSLPNNIKDHIFREGDSDFIIENTVLDKFEKLLKFKSLRTDIQEREAQFLKNGGDPEDPSSPDHHFIEDDFMRTFFNLLIEVKIGREIIKYLNDSTLISITDGNLNTLQQIRQTGQIPRLTPPATEPANGIPISEMPPIIPANIQVENTIVSIANQKQFTIADFAAIANTLTASFINFSSGPAVLSYYWDFGDGFGSYQTNPSHTYASAGSYLVTLTVTDGLYNNVPFSKTVHVLSCNANWNHTANGLFANFSDASVGIGTLTYSWDFGDPTSINNTSALQNPSHTFSAFGAYHVCLTIVDGAACLKTSCRDITINDPALDLCCDKNDRVVEKWNQYASDRKAKSVLKLRNATFFGIHYIHAKTNNYKRNFFNAWVPKKTDGIYVYFEGTVYQTSQNGNYHTNCVVEASQTVSVCAANATTSCPPKNCCYKQDKHDADAMLSNGGNNFIDRIFVKQNSIISTHKIFYNGNEYESNISPLSITEDCD